MSGQHKSNVIALPGAYELLVRKAMEAMEDGDIELTIDFCEQALAQNPSDETAVFVLVASLFELDQKDGAKKIFDNFRALYGITNSELHHFYVRLLMDMKLYKEAMDYIGHLTFTRQIHEDDVSQYEALKKLLTMLCQNDSGTDRSEEFAEYISERLSSGSPTEVMYCISMMPQMNVSTVLDSVKMFLLAENHPLPKTYLLEILMTQQVDELISVEKFGQTVLFNPITFTSTKDSVFYQTISKKMQELYENDNPSMYQMVIDKIDEHNQMLFPLPFSTSELDAWISAYDFYFKVSFGDTTEEIPTEIAEIMEWILKIDEEMVEE